MFFLALYSDALITRSMETEYLCIFKDNTVAIAIVSDKLHKRTLISTQTQDEPGVYKKSDYIMMEP